MIVLLWVVSHYVTIADVYAHQLFLHSLFLLLRVVEELNVLQVRVLIPNLVEAVVALYLCLRSSYCCHVYTTLPMITPGRNSDPPSIRCLITSRTSSALLAMMFCRCIVQR